MVRPSETNLVVGEVERLLLSVVCVSADEILEQQLRVSKIAGVIFVALTMDTHEGLLQVGGEPNPPLHGLRVQQVLSFFDELVCAHLHILVKQVAPQDLLSVLVVDQIGRDEKHAQSSLGDKGQVFVVEEHVVVVQEDEGCRCCENGPSFVHGVLNVQVGHIVVPLGVMRV